MFSGFFLLTFFHAPALLILGRSVTEAHWEVTHNSVYIWNVQLECDTPVQLGLLEAFVRYSESATPFGEKEFYLSW